MTRFYLNYRLTRYVLLNGTEENGTVLFRTVAMVSPLTLEFSPVGLG